MFEGGGVKDNARNVTGEDLLKQVRVRDTAEMELAIASGPGELRLQIEEVVLRGLEEDEACTGCGESQSQGRADGATRAGYENGLS